MNVLQIDQGNSAVKWRLMAADVCIDRGSTANADLVTSADLIAALAQTECVWVASVAAGEARSNLEDLCREQGAHELKFAHAAARWGDLVNSYAEPATMGVDRWLAMVGARARSEQELCVVDIGSALTIDRVAPDGRHRGGYILPGLGLMQQALKVSTAKVRYSEFPELSLAPGCSTGEAVSHGIALAMVGAVEAALREARDHEPAVILTGGSAGALQNLLSVRSTYVADLVLEGLGIVMSDD